LLGRVPGGGRFRFNARRCGGSRPRGIVPREPIREGELIAPEDGEYELGLAADDAFRLYLNGAMVIEDRVDGAERYRSVRRALRQGERIPVTIEYYQAKGHRILRFAWRTPSELRALAAAGPALDLRTSTYLPAGTDWYDFWTHERHRGGQTVTRDAHLDIIPLYVRAGSIIPMSRRAVLAGKVGGRGERDRYRARTVQQVRGVLRPAYPCRLQPLTGIMTNQPGR
jgi:hypothetical protein